MLSNKAEAGAIERAARLGVESMVFDRDIFYNSEQVLARLRQERIDFVVLAGFLWLVPDYLIASLPDRIVNIHPALLPKYGGKGMYGDRVHQAVVEAGEKESGITIHRVNSQYDSGDIIAQHRGAPRTGRHAARGGCKSACARIRILPASRRSRARQIVVRFLQGKIIGASQSRKRETTYRSHAPKATKGANAPTDKNSTNSQRPGFSVVPLMQLLRLYLYII